MLKLLIGKITSEEEACRKGGQLRRVFGSSAFEGDSR